MNLVAEFSEPVLKTPVLVGEAHVGVVERLQLIAQEEASVPASESLDRTSHRDSRWRWTWCESDASRSAFDSLSPMNFALRQFSVADDDAVFESLAVQETRPDLRHKMTLWRRERNHLRDGNEGCGWRRRNCPGVRRIHFYKRLNQVLGKAGFDAFVEGLYARCYAAVIGRPSLLPGRYFRMLLVGYFEGLNSERAIAWRVADSMSVRAFLDYRPQEASPNHSTLSRTRRQFDAETHREVFRSVLAQLANAGLVRGKTIGSTRRRWRLTWRCAVWCGGTREKPMKPS